jgi:hypothetical protein
MNTNNNYDLLSNAFKNSNVNDNDDVFDSFFLNNTNNDDLFIKTTGEIIFWSKTIKNVKTFKIFDGFAPKYDLAKTTSTAAASTSKKNKIINELKNGKKRKSKTNGNKP